MSRFSIGDDGKFSKWIVVMVAPHCELLSPTDLYT